jgi:hypothetical protein
MPVTVADGIWLGQAERGRTGEYSQRRWRGVPLRNGEQQVIVPQPVGLEVGDELADQLSAELEATVLLVLRVWLDEETRARSSFRSGVPAKGLGTGSAAGSMEVHRSARAMSVRAARCSEIAPVSGASE